MWKRDISQQMSTEGQDELGKELVTVVVQRGDT